MNNQQFLKIISLSFKKILETGSRSNEKLKILHGAIANDLSQRLDNTFQICSLGFKEGREAKIDGRYIDKVVDITIKKNGSTIAGIGVKFVMQNYSQNSNNYFENMLGETANIRCAQIPYFQIFIIPEKLPYYDNNGKITKWESFTTHNALKYIILSKDDINQLLHTPTKTLLFVIKLPDIEQTIATRSEYISSYSKIEEIVVSESLNSYGQFDNSVIYNNYEMFAQKLVYYILSL